MTQRREISPFVTGIVTGLVLIIILIGATFYSGVAIQTKTQSVTSISVRNETAVSTVTSTQTSVQTSTTTSYTTEITTLTSTSTSSVTAVLAKNASILITSAKLVIITPAGFSIFNATVVNRTTQLVTNVTMVFQNSTFLSNVSGQNPLFPGESTTFRFTYYGGGSSPTGYPALLYGTFLDGPPFAYVESVVLTCPPDVGLCS